MRKMVLVITIGFVACSFIACGSNLGVAKAPETRYRRLSVEQYIDKMKAGWVGQMAGVGWGAPTEFKWKGSIIPIDKMPKWNPGMINQFRQDDIYVEMTFLRTLELYGLDVSIRQAGIDFANSGYGLWHANKAGRKNLRAGIAPPDSGHPKFNDHADDIDYQIEADYSGLISPGLGNGAVQLGEKFGRLMNYGDGLYGGQFVGAMYAEAFFEDDMEKVVEAGLKYIPSKSQYAECINDTLRWYRQNPNDWKKTWALIDQKYQKNHEYRKFSCGGPNDKFNIDAKINGAYIVMGLLYGKGDPDQTIIISTRCGQDSDCNPSNAAGVLFTAIGFEKLPNKFKSAINMETKFSHTTYNFPKLIEVCQMLAGETLKQAGGKIEKGQNGKDVFVIPVQKPRQSKLQQCWSPGPVANSRFTEAESDKITGGVDLSKEMSRFAPGWKVTKCRAKGSQGLCDALGRKNVLVTHPLDKDLGCVISRKVQIGEGKTVLRLTLGHHPSGDWDLIVKVNGKEEFKKTIAKKTAQKGWLDVEVDLSKYAGKKVKIELVNQPTGQWLHEAGYWGKIKLVN